MRYPTIRTSKSPSRSLALSLSSIPRLSWRTIPVRRALRTTPPLRSRTPRRAQPLPFLTLISSETTSFRLIQHRDDLPRGKDILAPVLLPNSAPGRDETAARGRTLIRPTRGQVHE